MQARTHAHTQAKTVTSLQHQENIFHRQTRNKYQLTPMNARAAASCAVHRAGRLVWSTGDGRRSMVDGTWPRPPSLSAAVNNRPTAVACYLTLGDGGRAVAKFSKSMVWDMQSSRKKYPYF